MALVRKDEQGLFVICDGVIARPGNVRGYDHALRMDGGGLTGGEKVPCRQLSGSPLVKLKLPDDAVVFWHSDGRDLTRTFDFEPNSFDASGRLKRTSGGEVGVTSPREISVSPISDVLGITKAR
jgi:hypothetical protein